MDTVSPYAAWALAADRPARLRLAGLDRSAAVEAALAELDGPVLASGLGTSADEVSPEDVLWRVECGGELLNAPDLLARHWHRAPYAMTIRLVCRLPGAAEADILDEATIGTTGPWDAFRGNAERMALRLVGDAVRGRSRGASGRPPAAAPSGLPGWVGHAKRRWRDRLMSEWWSLGSTTMPLDAVLDGETLRDIRWYAPRTGARYLADPFPWPSTNMILCEEMPRSGGIGRIVSVSNLGDRLSPPVVLVLDDGRHHSYPCTLVEGGAVYCVPETPLTGGTEIFRLEPDGTLTPVAAVAPAAKLADPTLFRWQDEYWIACTDLDIGLHDNLCLLHAPSLQGPWTPHRTWPVKIDIRGARPAGSVIHRDGGLFRPAQDCAGEYGAGIALHRITRLTPTDFAETLIGVLRPDPHGPFPDGLHTLSCDGERIWVDGKRLVPDLRHTVNRLRQKHPARRTERKDT